MEMNNDFYKITRQIYDLNKEYEKTEYQIFWYFIASNKKAYYRAKRFIFRHLSSHVECCNSLSGFY